MREIYSIVTAYDFPLLNNDMLRRLLIAGSFSFLLLLFIFPLDSSAQTNVSGTIASHTTWDMTGSPYIVVGDITVNTGVTLTVDPGVEVKFNGNYNLTVNGMLSAVGNASQMITFTSNSPTPQPGDWQYIKINWGNGPQSVLNYVNIRYADRGIYLQNTYWYSVPIPTIDNSVVEHNNYGFYLEDDVGPVVSNNMIVNNNTGIMLIGHSYFPNVLFPSTATINSNEIHNNANYNMYVQAMGVGLAPFTINAENNWWGSQNVQTVMAGIYDYNDNNNLAVVDFTPYLDAPNGNPIGQNYIYGRINGNRTLTTALSPYSIVSNIFVPYGITLTVDPGVDVKFDGNFNLTVDGLLNAVGNANQMITFTSNSSTPQPGDWQYLRINNTSGAQSTLSYVNVRYSDRGIYLESAVYGGGGSPPAPTIDRSVIEYNNRGFYLVDNVFVTVTNSQIINNDYGLYLRGDYIGIVAFPILTANNNEIRTNTTYNMYTERGFGLGGHLNIYTVNAENNWWGSQNVQTVMAGIHDYNDDNNLAVADFTPYLDAPNGNPIGQNYIYGKINGNTTLTAANSPYVVLSNLNVAYGATLTVDAGVDVKFDGNYNLIIDGTLNAVGNAGQMITFTSNQATPQPGDWQYIKINWGNGPQSVLNYVNIRYADRGIYLQNTYWYSVPMPTIDNSVIEHNNFGFYLLDSVYPTITNSQINNNGFGFYTRLGFPAVIDNNTIANNSEGIHMVCDGASCRQVRIHNNSIYGSTAYNVTMENVVPVDLSSVTIDSENNWWGTNDPIAITQAILDHADNPLLPVVDFDPFLNSPGGAPLVFNVSFGPQFFDHLNNELVTIHYDLQLAANVTIKIFNQSHTLVRTVINNVPKPIGTNQDTWDGKDDNMQLLPEGLYYFEISAITSQNEAGGYSPPYYSGSVQITTGSVTPSSADPYKGDTFNITYDMVASGFVTLRAGRFDYPWYQNYRELITNQPRDTSGNLDIWDGRDDNGNIILDTTNQVVYGWTNILPDNALVIRDNSAAQVEFIKADPYVMYPRYGEATDIHYRLSLDAIVLIEIRDPSGYVVRTLLNNQQQVAGDHNIVWDGKDDLGKVVSGEGHYRIKVQALDLRGPVTRSLTGNITVFK